MLRKLLLIAASLLLLASQVSAQGGAQKPPVPQYDPQQCPTFVKNMGEIEEERKRCRDKCGDFVSCMMICSRRAEEAKGKTERDFNQGKELLRSCWEAALDKTIRDACQANFETKYCR